MSDAMGISQTEVTRQAMPLGLQALRERLGAVVRISRTKEGLALKYKDAEFAIGGLELVELGSLFNRAGLDVKGL